MVFTPTKPPLLLVIDLHQIEVDPPSSWAHALLPISLQMCPRLSMPSASNLFHDEFYPIEANASFIAPHACAVPLPDELIFIKNTGSAFASSKLKETLPELHCGDREIVVIGMEGAKCVNSTVRGAKDLGLNMVVVVDACASFGVDYFKREKVGAEEVHKVAMSILASSYARLVETDDLVRELGKWDGTGRIDS
ncbi:isochorismatase hydrolase [Botrytis cinerea]